MENSRYLSQTQILHNYAHCILTLTRHNTLTIVLVSTSYVLYVGCLNKIALHFPEFVMCRLLHFDAIICLIYYVNKQ